MVRKGNYVGVGLKSHKLTKDFKQIRIIRHKGTLFLKEASMTKKIMSVITIIHEQGLDDNGFASLREQIPYWTDFLNEEYGSFDYPSDVKFVKGLGFRVFRNGGGKHKLIYDSDVTEL